MLWSVGEGSWWSELVRWEALETVLRWEVVRCGRRVRGGWLSACTVGAVTVR
jgi:hypothetical protein